MGCRLGAEIGVARGKSALIWCKANPDLHLIGIDPWCGSQRLARNYRQAVENLSSLNVRLWKTTSAEALSRVKDRSLDFVHIDGNHEFDFCCPDIIYWARKVRAGGVIMVHDMVWHDTGVIEAVRAYTYAHHIDPWYVTKDKIATAFWENR